MEMSQKNRERMRHMPFADVYPMYLQKAERKGRTREDVDKVICWLTGYDPEGLIRQVETRKDLETFFSEAPAMHPAAGKITGTICGYRIEDIQDPLEKKVRWLDKLVDELAKGRTMEKILRT